jgi:hypothetical protein
VVGVLVGVGVVVGVLVGVGVVVGVLVGVDRETPSVNPSSKTTEETARPTRPDTFSVNAVNRLKITREILPPL